MGEIACENLRGRLGRQDCRANHLGGWRGWGKFGLLPPGAPRLSSFSPMPIIPTTPAPDTASPVFTARIEADGVLFAAPAALPLLLAAEQAGLALLAAPAATAPAAPASASCSAARWCTASTGRA